MEKIENIAVVEMADKIMEVVRTKIGTSFVNLDCIEGFEGDLAYGKEEKNIWFWFSVSETAAQALNLLLAQEKLEIRPTNILVYFVDGRVPGYPLAKRVYAYKKEHWLPVCLYSKKSA